jgi:hypothetical protein
LDKSLEQIRQLYKTAKGPARRSLATAKKLLEQAERLLDKNK